MTEAIGWISSLILLITIAKQVHKQWQEGTSEGVSIWLFIGQITASAGFLTYSLLVWTPVFIVTNALMVINGLIGLGLVMYHQNGSKQEA